MEIFEKRITALEVQVQELQEVHNNINNLKYEFKKNTDDLLGSVANLTQVLREKLSDGQN